jgi:hypothetical protein
MIRHIDAAVGRGRKLSAAVAGLAALSVGTLGFASGAGATGPTPLSARPLTVEGAGTSDGLAGYLVAPTGGLASASVTFTVPTITCSSAEKADGAAQYDGVYTLSLDIYALVATICTSSGASYEYSFSTEAGNFVEGGAAAGDVVVTSLFESGTSSWAKIHDLTNGAYWFADNSVNQGDATVAIGALNDTYAALPIPNYTKANFTNATANGDYLGFESPGKYNTVNPSDSVLIAKPSKLKTTATGSSFSVAFKHSV